MNSIHYVLYTLTFLASTCLPLYGMHKPKGIIRKIYRSLECASASIFRPHDTPVFMNDAKTITLAPGAKKPITISTTGLIGCAATLLYAHDGKQYKHAILTHFEPNADSEKDHIRELEHRTQLLQLQMGHCNLMKFIVIMPQCAYWSTQEAHDIIYKKMRTKLQNVIKNTYPDTSIQMLYAPYELAPRGKFYATQVQATLSHNHEPSLCTISNWSQDYIFNLEETINNS